MRFHEIEEGLHGKGDQHQHQRGQMVDRMGENLCNGICGRGLTQAIKSVKKIKHEKPSNQ